MQARRNCAQLFGVPAGSQVPFLEANGERTFVFWRRQWALTAIDTGIIDIQTFIAGEG
jgi:sugar/nucleoside kinase (ribokinase family)